MRSTDREEHARPHGVPDAEMFLRKEINVTFSRLPIAAAALLLPLALSWPTAAQVIYQANTSLGEAIRAAEAALPGGIAVEGELEADRERPYYEIDVDTDEGIRRVVVNAEDGEIFSVDDTSFGESVGRFLVDLFTDDATVAPGDLQRAVEAAERELGARAVEAELDGEEPVYEVEVIDDDGRQIEVTVNAEGTVLPDDAD